MKNDLNELNSVMFDTLRSLQAGKIDAEKAKAMSTVGGIIINNAKTQLAAAKLLKGKRIQSEVFGGEIEKSNEPKKIENTYDSKTEFAISLGYDTPGKAIADIGAAEFKRLYDECVKYKN